MTGHLAAYRRHLRDLGRADSTVEGYLELLTRMDRELPQGLTSACEDELRDWINTDGHGRATRNWYRTVVCGFFAWCCDPDEPRLDFNPARRLPRVSVPEATGRPVPTEQLQAILAIATRPHLDWYLLAALAGLRCIEISRLRRQDVTEIELWVVGKGGKSRVIPTHPLIWQAIQDLPPGLVAAGLTPQQISHQGNYNLKKVLGHDDMHMHLLRHWFLTGVYESSGEDIEVARELAGHASVSTTQRYIKGRGNRKRTAVAGLPAVA